MEMKTVLLIVTIMVTLSRVCSTLKVRRASNDSDQPLILTQMIQDGNIENAQDLSKVTPLQGDVTSYSGFLTVNETYNSNIFFWFFPASNGDETSPVIVWMFGGLGFSSMYSIFIEMGPYKIGENLSLELNEASLTTNFSVIYIDNPVGAGFSFTDSDQGYSTNKMEISSNLYSALIQFFKLFPKYQANDFYMVGESEGGKWAVVTSHAIHKNNPSAEVKINLKGLAIGNGMIDPISMVCYDDFLPQIGLIDSEEAEKFHHADQEITQLLENQKYSEAFDAYNRMMLGFPNGSSLFRNTTGFKYPWNFLYTRNYTDFSEVPRFIEQPNNREALHVADTKFDLSSKEVFDFLKGRLLESAKPEFEELLENYKVMLFNGQLDILVPYSLTAEFVDTLNWSKSSEFQDAPRTKWYVGDNLAGYDKEGGNLRFVLIRNAGHFTSIDQPAWTLDLFNKFISQT